jgi:hypothetical protein
VELEENLLTKTSQKKAGFKIQTLIAQKHRWNQEQNRTNHVICSVEPGDQWKPVRMMATELMVTGLGSV